MRLIPPTPNPNDLGLLTWMMGGWLVILVVFVIFASLR